MSYVAPERVWLGTTPHGHEICILGDFSKDALDGGCEALAVRELGDVDALLARIATFLDTVREPYLDPWTSRRWEVLSLVFTRQDEEGPATFVAEYLLERDEYTVWQVHVRDGRPIALTRR